MKWMRIGGMAAFVAALAIGLALSLGLWANWTAGAAGTERIVNSDTGAGDPAPCNSPNFASVSDIETVIDDASVHNGDTLILCPGTYQAPDAVEVDKELTIEGLAAANRQDVTVQGPGGTGFEIKADNVKIRHLKLVGPGTGGPGQGILLAPVGPTAYKNAEFSDLEITNWASGLRIVQSDDTKVGPNNNIHANFNGVVIASGVLGGRRDRVFNNTIEANLGPGIYLPGADEAYLEQNTLSGNSSQIAVTGESTVFIWNNNIETTANLGVYVNSPTADTLVQIGGSPQRTNNFTGSLTPGVGFYADLECGSENTVDATYNYWNGINSGPGISAVVFNDEFDDPTSGTADCAGDDKGAVAIHPFVTAMWTPSPTPTPSPSATATGTPTPTPTPGGATRTVNLSPQGWHDLAWSGPDGTAPATALSCVSGKYSIAYAWNAATGKFERYVEGCAEPALCNMGPLDKYDSLMVLIGAAGVTCQMPVQ